MKIKFFTTAYAILFSAVCIAQSVGINNTNPDASSILDVKSNNKGVLLPRTSTTSRNAIANPAKGLLLYDSTASGFWFYNGNAWTQLSGGGGTNYWTASGANIYKNNTGNVGINSNSPANTLQIGSMGSTGLATNDFAIGNGINAMAIQQTNASTLWGSSTDIILKPRNDGSGYVGINTLTAPANKLQIGSIGNTGFATNDFAIGNGTAAMAIYQTNTSTLIGSTTDIILKPRNNGAGRVGINTNTPRAPLEVADMINVAALGVNGYSFMASSSGVSQHIGYSSASPVYNVSIIAAGSVYAFEFDAYSDARIKNVTDISNGANDLATVNALKITDYTMKDQVKYGNQKFKKVIAQEVEKVYPQVVSKHTDFIPNVYQLTSKIVKTDNGYLLTFAGKHNISKTAKTLRAIVSQEEMMQQYSIIRIPGDNQVEIEANELKADKIFVYGEEVDDFRTVDYEGLTTLNISATQELSKQLKKQQQQIKLQQQQIMLLAGEIKLLKRPLNKLTSAKQGVINSKTKKSKS